MSKELEALERIRSHNYHELPKRECLRIIETALKENIKMREYIDMVDKTFVDVETTKKKLKALEILKKHIRIVKPIDLETKKEESFEIFDIDLWNAGKQKEDFEFVKEVLL